MRHRNFRKLLIAALPFFAALSGCAANSPVSPELSGNDKGNLGAFTLSSAKFVQPELAPTICESGDPSYFLGADFSDGKTGVIVRFVLDPLRGPAMRVFNPADPFNKSIVFSGSDCSMFDFSFEPTGWRVNHVDDFRITLDIDCKTSTGDILRGKASSTHCNE